MSKTDKELAVEVAISCIQANSNKQNSNGQSFPNLNIDSITNIIKAVHQTLADLDEDNEE